MLENSIYKQLIQLTFDHILGDPGEMGISINESLTSRRNLGTLETFGEDFQSAPYRIETVDNVPLPFCLTQEREWDKVIDLVVCMSEYSSAKAALEDFDISICKCAWDGRSFSIADPHNTFRRRSSIGPEKRKSFLASYKHHFNSGVYNKIGPTLAAVQRDGIELPLPLLRNGPLKEKRARNNEIHNYALRTFKRIGKYSRRGIVFDDNFTEIAQEFRGRPISSFHHFERRNWW